MSASLRRTLWGLAAALLAACSWTYPPPAPGQFDLGPARSGDGPATQSRAVTLGSVQAPVWLDGTGISYRLNYQDPYRREIYRDSRWIAPPAALLAQRLRERLARLAAAPGTALASTVPVLSLELEEFGQEFSAPAESRVVIRVHARLAVAGPAVTREREFKVEQPAATPDARGAVAALASGADALGEQLALWVIQP